jgi:hypothetical protein
MCVCRTCQLSKSDDEFYTYPDINGKPYRHPTCRQCHCKRKKSKAALNRRHAKDANERRLGIDRAKWVLRDSRASDRKRGQLCSLVISDVEQLISQPCRYCGETKLRMTLDRVDNSGGHTIDNVVPACERCNYIRRDMPAAAWSFLLEGLTKARLAGAFGNWTCSVWKRFLSEGQADLVTAPASNTGER